MADTDEIPEADRIEGAPHPRHAPRLIGQDAAVAEFMARRETGRMHHGWLLSGLEGVGKATFAWAAARTLLGDAPGFDLAPDDPVARRVAALAEPRLALCRIGWDHEKKRLKTQITVEEIRKLKGFFGLSAADGGWRVAIVDAAEQMNAAAANALLKILEEPPEKTAIFLVSHAPGRLLPTIRSRTVSLGFQPLGPDDMADALREAGIDGGADPRALAELSGGSVGRAVRLLSGGGAELYAAILAALADLPRLDRQQVIALGEKAASRGPEDHFGMIRQLVSLLLSRAARAAATGTAPAEAAPGEARILARLAPTPRAAGIWATALPEIEGRAAHAAAVNLDPATVILDTFLRIEAAARRLGE